MAMFKLQGTKLAREEDDDGSFNSYVENPQFREVFGSFKKLPATQHKLKLYSRHSRVGSAAFEDGSGADAGRETIATGSSGSNGGGSKVRTRSWFYDSRGGSYAHSERTAVLLARRAKSESLTRREHVFLFLEEPGSSAAAFLFSAVLQRAGLDHRATVTRTSALTSLSPHGPPRVD